MKVLWDNARQKKGHEKSVSVGSARDWPYLNRLQELHLKF